MLQEEADEQAKLAKSFGRMKVAFPSESQSSRSPAPARGDREPGHGGIQKIFHGNAFTEADPKTTPQSSGIPTRGAFQSSARGGASRGGAQRSIRGGTQNAARRGATRGGTSRGGIARGGGRGGSQTAAGNRPETASAQAGPGSSRSRQPTASAVQLSEIPSKSGKSKYWQCHILISTSFVRVFHAWFRDWIAAENDCRIDQLARLPQNRDFRYVISSAHKENTRHAYSRVLDALNEWHNSSQKDEEMATAVFEIKYDLNNYGHCVKLSDYMKELKNIENSQVKRNGRLVIREARHRDLDEIRDKTGVSLEVRSKVFELIKDDAPWKETLTHQIEIKSWSATQTRKAHDYLCEKRSVFAGSEQHRMLEGWHSVGSKKNPLASSSTETEDKGEKLTPEASSQQVEDVFRAKTAAGDKIKGSAVTTVLDTEEKFTGEQTAEVSAP